MYNEYSRMNQLFVLSLNERLLVIEDFCVWECACLDFPVLFKCLFMQNA